MDKPAPSCNKCGTTEKLCKSNQTASGYINLCHGCRRIRDKKRRDERKKGIAKRPSVKNDLVTVYVPCHRCENPVPANIWPGDKPPRKVCRSCKSLAYGDISSEALPNHGDDN